MSSIIPNQAIVLAGGFGTRLRTVVSDVPKPMAPINDRPFLEYLLDYMARQGVLSVTLAVGYLGEQVEAHFGDSYADLRLVYSYEREPLGTGGAVREALKLLNTREPVWIFNGDTFFACDLSACAKTHREQTADVTLALKRMPDAGRYGLIEVNDKCLVSAFTEKRAGASGLINAGVYLIDPSALGRFDLPRPGFSLERDFLGRYLLDLRLLSCPQDAYFVDIGVPEDYAAAQAYFRET